MQYECRAIECGATFDYERQSCGHHAAPNYCPDCGRPDPVESGSEAADAVCAEHDRFLASAQEDLQQAAETAAEERTRIGNTPTCEDCHQPQDHCTCEETEEEDEIEQARRTR
jgi:hypothetical protein